MIDWMLLFSCIGITVTGFWLIEKIAKIGEDAKVEKGETENKQ